MASGLRSGSNNLDKQVKKDKNCDKSNSGDLINNPSNISMHDCCVYESGISKIDLYLQCNTCHSYMHGACWDNDASAQIYEYLLNASSNGCVHVRVYCHRCANRDILSKVDERIQKLEERIESSLRALSERPQDRTYATVAAQNIAIPSNANPLTQQPAVQYNRSGAIHNEVAEAMEKERRKRNIIVFNLLPSHSGDTVRLTALFEHLTGAKPPSFRSRRIGKPRTGKIQPVLVQFASELDRIDILHSARNLKDLQAEWPRVGIAPDRTKNEQETHRQQRNNRSEQRERPRQHLRTDSQSQSVAVSQISAPLQQPDKDHSSSPHNRQPRRASTSSSTTVPDASARQTVPKSVN